MFMYHLLFPAKILQFRYVMIFEHCLSLSLFLGLLYCFFFCPYWNTAEYDEIDYNKMQCDNAQKGGGATDHDRQFVRASRQ
jgi:hypothetical protein